MNTFWLKIAGVVVVVLAVIFLIKNFLMFSVRPEAEPKTFYDVVAEDDKRLRSDIEPLKLQQADANLQTKQASPDEPKAEVEQPQPGKEIPIEDQVQAERLFEMALSQRKMGRLPGMSYKLMVDYCREIIEKYPDSPESPKARRMLGEVPSQYWERYNITEEEVNPPVARRINPAD